MPVQTCLCSHYMYTTIYIKRSNKNLKKYIKTNALEKFLKIFYKCILSISLIVLALSGITEELMYMYSYITFLLMHYESFSGCVTSILFSKLFPGWHAYPRICLGSSLWSAWGITLWIRASWRGTRTNWIWCKYARIYLLLKLTYGSDFFTLLV